MTLILLLEAVALYQFGEFLCSLLPLFILVFQMFPSLSLLYFSGLSYLDSSLTVKKTQVSAKQQAESPQYGFFCSTTYFLTLLDVFYHQTYLHSYQFTTTFLKRIKKNSEY
uniref:Cytochrome c oxidase polypeptide II n=1 Tax=Strongyloides stercoralis TaxID=6248 RepID=A0A0K0ETR5_STRER